MIFFNYRNFICLFVSYFAYGCLTDKMTDSKYFTTTKKGEIFELKSELNNEKKEKKKEAVKKVIHIYSY